MLMAMVMMATNVVVTVVAVVVTMAMIQVIDICRPTNDAGGGDFDNDACCLLVFVFWLPLCRLICVTPRAHLGARLVRAFVI